MSNSKSSLKSSMFSSRSRLLPSCFRRAPRVHIRGLLGTTAIKNGQDLWMATDFVVLRHLLGARDELSKWMCGTPIRVGGKFILGDPACDRIVFDPPPFESVFTVEPITLLTKYILEVSNAAAMLPADETLVLVLVGHGVEENRSFEVGDQSDFCEFRKEALEECVRGTKGNIVVISTACYSGSWESKHWTLIAAAGPDQEAPSIVESGSGEYRGGFFTNALLAEFAQEYQINAPCPGSLDTFGRRGPQRDHDFGPEKNVHPSLRHPKPCLQAIVDWIHQFRDVVGRIYTSADVTFIPCKDGPNSQPFTSLTLSRTPFHRLPCVPPSPAADHASLHSSSRPSIILPAQQLSSETLSESEGKELVELATNLRKFMPIATACEIPMLQRCRITLYGPGDGQKPLDEAERRRLLFDLRNRVRHQELALAIATNLGWSKAIAELGDQMDRKCSCPQSIIYKRRRTQVVAWPQLWSSTSVGFDPGVQLRGGWRGSGRLQDVRRLG